MPLLQLRKMQVQHTEPIHYTINFKDVSVDINALLGKPISLQHTGNIYCMECGKKTSKSYGQGYCFPCFSTIPETEECVLHPEKCKAHLGVARDMEWAKEHCLQPHIVYLAFSSEVKVGVTRISQVPTRWMDQGALGSIILAQTPNRHIAGIIEVFLKKTFADKTSWSKMLVTNQFDENLLIEAKQKATALLPTALKSYVTDNLDIFRFHYPQIEQPIAVKSVTFDKEAKISGVLTAIKGQYLIFDNEKVINIRSAGGYEVEVSF